MKRVGTLIKIQYRAADDKKLYEHEYKPEELAALTFSQTQKQFSFPGIYTSKGIENMKHNPKNRFPIDGRKWYMNINTGSVDKGSNWIQEFKEADPDERHGWFDGLEEVPKPKKHKNPKKSKRTCKMSLAERKAWGKRMQSLRNAKKGKTRSNPKTKKENSQHESRFINKIEIGSIAIPYSKKRKKLIAQASPPDNPNKYILIEQEDKWLLSSSKTSATTIEGIIKSMFNRYSDKKDLKFRPNRKNIKKIEKLINKGYLK